MRVVRVENLCNVEPDIWSYNSVSMCGWRRCLSMGYVVVHSIRRRVILSDIGLFAGMTRTCYGRFFSTSEDWWGHNNVTMSQT
jgi:hypothetical protein